MKNNADDRKGLAIFGGLAAFVLVLSLGCYLLFDSPKTEQSDGVRRIVHGNNNEVGGSEKFTGTWLSDAMVFGSRVSFTINDDGTVDGFPRSATWTSTEDELIIRSEGGERTDRYRLSANGKELLGDFDGLKLLFRRF